MPCHCNDATHNVNATNQECIVPKAVHQTTNVLADKNAPKENAELNAIQANVQKVSYAVTMHALLVVAIIWIVQVIDPASTENVKIHAHWKMHAEIMQFVV